MSNLQSFFLPLLALLPGKDVLVGCIDVATQRLETPDEVADTIGASRAQANERSTNAGHSRKGSYARNWVMPE